MNLHFREQVDDHDPSHNQSQSDVGWQVGDLLEHEDADERDEHDAEGTPDGVGYADGHSAEGMRQEVKRQHVARQHGDGGQRTGELLREFEHRGGKRLQDDGTNQKQPFFHCLIFLRKNI